MTIRASGLHGRPPARALGYIGEILVNDAGVYIGDFSGGYGVEGTMPLGFAHAMNGWHTGPTTGIFSTYWDDPSDWAFASVCYVPWTVQPTLAGAVVTDNSGPAGREAANACQIDFAGTPGQFAWIGQDASLMVGQDSVYTGGWFPAHGSQWTMSGWLRAVPDTNGFVCTGFNVGFSIAQWGNTTIGVGGLAISEAWQLLTVNFTWLYAAGPAFAFVGSGDSRFSHGVTRTNWLFPNGSRITATKADAYGRIHVKDLHLYPYPGQQLGGPYHLNQRI